MSSIYKIKESLADFTDTEKKIAEYILNNKDEVVNFSSQKLAEEVGASAAAIVRFSKRLGFKGFTHLKVEIAKDTGEATEMTVDRFINETDTVDVMMKKALYANIQTLENTYKLIQSFVLEAAIESLVSAKEIYLVGVGGSQIVVSDLHQKFKRIHKSAYASADYHDFLGMMSHIESQDVLVAFSYSGETKEILYASQVARERGAKVIAITQSSRNELSKVADYALTVPKEETDLRIGSISSRFAMNAISDLLYVGVAKSNIDDTKNRLVTSLDTVKGYARFVK